MNIASCVLLTEDIAERSLHMTALSLPVHSSFTKDFHLRREKSPAKPSTSRLWGDTVASSHRRGASPGKSRGNGPISSKQLVPYTARLWSEHHSFSDITVTPRQFTLRQIDDTGREIDRFEIHKP